MARRRAAGEGSIFQRQDGRWVAKLTLPDGKVKTFYAKSQREAGERLVPARADAQRGLPLPSGRQTLGPFLAEWLEGIRPSIAPSTYTRYRYDVRRIDAVLGRVRLAELSPQRIQAFLNDLHARGLRPRPVRHCHAVLRAALTAAEHQGLIARNPAAGKRVRLPRAPRRTIESLSVEQARAILAAFTGHAFESLVLTALGTGLRAGELLGLRWQDVDLGRGTLAVRFQVQRVDGQVVFREPKSEDSRATIPLVPFVVDSLTRQRERVQQLKLLAGPRWREHQLVFPSQAGTPMDSSNVVHRFQAQLQRSGLPRMGMHDLRHGTATLLHGLGVDLRTIQAILRHSQISLTMNTYTNVGISIKHDALARIEEALAPEPPQ